MGNSALVKCEIPSFVADFVSVINWIDNDGNEFFPSAAKGEQNFIKIKGDTQPNLFLEVDEKGPLLSDLLVYVHFLFAVVAQTYSTDAQHKVYVILGNSALVKCDIPSFVADFVSVVSWVDNEGVEFYPNKMGKFDELVYSSIMGHTCFQNLSEIFERIALLTEKFLTTY